MEGSIAEWMNECVLCPRECRVDRRRSDGVCRTIIKTGENGEELIPAARAALHFGEEPCISGKNGSGAVFFTGCGLKCRFCQNIDISRGCAGKYVTAAALSDVFLRLEEQGAENINLVTAGHVLPVVIKAIEHARSRGLSIPFVYNTSAYEKKDALLSLEGLVDVYLPDLKTLSPIIAKRFFGAQDYPEVAKTAIEEMVRQTGSTLLGEDGMIKRGVVVRHMVMPGCVSDSKKVLEYLHETYGDNIMISVLSQYTPVRTDEKYPVLNRRLRACEYRMVTDHAADIGISKGYMQSMESSGEDFIPAFDGTGL